MPLIVTRTARAMIYVVCVGGLLVLNSLIVTVLWNNVFRSSSSKAGDLSLLEGVGVTAVAYVIILAVRYAIKSVPKGATNPTAVPECARTNDERLSDLSPEERKALKAELVRSCGCQESRPASS